jgi:DNA-binding GntR family transcriptional regulator
MALIDGLSFRRTTTAQQLADGLSERILSGAIAPGRRMRESAIAAELGVARNTIREAVRILEIAGLVRCEVNRGAVVVSPTPDALRELYACRAVLEVAGIRATGSPERLGAVERAFDRLVEATDSRDAGRIVPADLDFHGAIVALQGNSRIQGFYQQLSRELHFYLMYLMARDSVFQDPSAIIDDHRVILDALLAGELDRAAAETIKHLDLNEARVLAALDA